MNGSLKIVKCFIKITLVDSYLCDFKQSIASKFLICYSSYRRIFDRSIFSIYLRGRYSSKIIGGILDNLLEMKNSFIFVLLLLEYLALVVMSFCVFIAFIEQLFKINQTLVKVLQLI